MDYRKGNRCKILNTPHVAGLDKTVGVLLEAGSLEMVAYNEFAADKVVINCIQASDGQSKTIGDESFYYIGDDLIIVASENKLISPEEIVAVLKWNPETDQFVLEQ